MKQCKCKKGLLVKIAPSNGSNTNSFNNNTLSISSISSPKEMDEYVVLESHMYEEIFKGKKNQASNDHKRLSVVKICSNNGKSIHRAFYSVPAKDFTGKYVALTSNSIYLLSDGPELSLGSELYLSKGSKWVFYWNHPNAAVRMSFRIGVLGILITIVFSFKQEIACIFTNIFNLFKLITEQ